MGERTAASVENSPADLEEIAGPPSSAIVSFRDADTLEERSLNWTLAGGDLLGRAAPWRTFRWYLNQRHYSGTYWSSTNKDHVIYESRLELARLLLADFDPTVNWIVAQPFHLKTVVNRRQRGHIPDFLLITSDVPVVIDVKPPWQLEKPKVKFTLAWTRTLVESRGWRYEVWSEPNAVEIQNVRFLAGYRNPSLFSPFLLEELREKVLEGRTLGDAFDTAASQPSALVRAAVLHMIWTSELTVDLSTTLTRNTILDRGLRK
jgi:hypothetical protein